MADPNTPDDKPTAPRPEKQDADELGKAQEDAAHEREDEGGYQ
jgi:hypothetical protein